MTGVVTQGSHYSPMWIEEFAIQVSADGSKWNEVRDENQDFAKVGNEYVSR